MRAVLEFRQLIGRQRRVEVVHDGRIGVTTRAKLHDPGTIFLSIFLWPLFDESVSHLGSGIAAMTTST